MTNEAGKQLFHAVVVIGCAIGGCNRDGVQPIDLSVAMADLARADASALPPDASLPADATCLAHDAAPDAHLDGGCPVSEDMSFPLIL